MLHGSEDSFKQRWIVVAQALNPSLKEFFFTTAICRGNFVERPTGTPGSSELINEVHSLVGSDGQELRLNVQF